MKKTKIISLLVIIGIIAVAAIYLGPKMSFMEDNYVDFPGGYRPWHEAYGSPGTFPLVVEWDNEYDEWYIELTIKNPSGVSKDITHEPTHNNPNWEHPDNWLVGGPHYIEIDAYDTWDVIGEYEITSLKLHAMFNPTREWHILDKLDTSDSASRRSIEVKHQPDIDVDITLSKTTVDNGEVVTIDLSLKNEGTSLVSMGYEMYVDIEQSGYHNEPVILGGFTESFAKGETITESDTYTVNYNHGKYGEIWIAFTSNTYGDDVFEVNYQEKHILIIDGSVPSLSCSINGPSYSQSKTIDFTSSVSGGELPYTYLWDFGDGQTSTQQNPTHTYQEYDSYLVSLTVTDNTDKITHDQLSITISLDEPPEPPEAFGFEFMTFIISLISTIYVVNKRKYNGKKK